MMWDYIFEQYRYNKKGVELSSFFIADSNEQTWL